MSYLEQLEKVLDHITSIGIYVIRRDTHEMLYFNDRVRAVAPAVRIGSVCHELWPDTCSNCPLLSIGDRESHTTVSYNDPFGGMVDITATRMLWAEGITGLYHNGRPAHAHKARAGAGVGPAADAAGDFVCLFNGHLCQPDQKPFFHG